MSKASNNYGAIMDTAEDFAPHLKRAADWVLKNTGPGGRGQWKGSSGLYAGQRQAQLAAKGAQGASSRRQSAITIARGTSGKMDVGKGSISNEGKRIMRDTVAHERPMIGSELIPSLSTNRLSAVSLKLGKRLTGIDVVSPFLKNLQQSGKISCQYGGRFKSSTAESADNPMNKQGERMVISQNFRHCWSDKNYYDPMVNAATPPANRDEYPDVNGNKVLKPICYNVGLPNATALQVSMDSPYYPHSNGDNNFAMISRPDCEDMMWNMNKLKLITDYSIFNDNTTNQGQSVGGYNSVANHPDMPMFHRNVAAYQPNRHFRISAIMANNAVSPKLTGAQPETVWNETPYKFNAMFKHGTVKYDFKNSEMTGARVEVIVYKQKKGRLSSDVCTDFSATTKYPSGRPLDNILPAISEGYIATVFDKIGTEDMGGRVPVPNDIYDNPMFPLLPELKKTKQGELRFKEFSRTAFALTSGAQRTLEIVLPGDEYDPVNIATLTKPSTDDDGNPIQGLSGHAVMDDHCYTVVIAVCGVKMSRLVSTVETADDLPTDQVVGEIHCPFNVEYLCTYTEHVSACKYKNPDAVNVFNNALVCDTKLSPNPDLPVQVYGSATTVVPLENTVRNTNKLVIPPVTSGIVGRQVDTGYASGGQYTL